MQSVEVGDQAVVSQDFQLVLREHHGGEPVVVFLAGVVLDVDGITGGYNFLNAWATSWCAGTEIARDVGALFEEE